MQLTFASLMLSAADEPDSMYGLAARAVRISADRLTYRYLLRPEARFHDGTKLTAHDVAFSLKLLKEKGHPIIGQMTRDLVGAEAEDDATVVLKFRAEARARRAAVRRRACRSSRAPIIRRAISTRRRSMRRSARVPTRSGVSSPDATSNTTASRTGGARTCRSRAGNTISTSCATSSIATAMSRSRASPPRATCSARSSPRASGRRATIFPPSRTDASSRAILPDDTPSGGQGWFMNTRRDKFKNIGLREAHDPRVRFRMDQQVHHVRRLQAHLLGVPEFQHDGRGQAGARPSSHCSSRSAARCPTRCSASRSCRRCRTGRARTARCCARRRNCCSRPAIRSRTASASTPRASRSRSNS